MATHTVRTAPGGYTPPDLVKEKGGGLDPQSTVLSVNAANKYNTSLTSAASAPADSDLTLSTAWQPVPGTSVEIPDPGTYLLTGIVDFDMTVAGATNAQARLSVAGAAEANIATVAFAAIDRKQGVQSWLITTEEFSQAVRDESVRWEKLIVEKRIFGE